MKKEPALKSAPEQQQPEISLEHQSKALGMTINNLSITNSQLITELNLTNLILKDKEVEINELQSQLAKLQSDQK